MVKLKTFTLSAATAALLATSAIAQVNSPAKSAQPEATPPAATQDNMNQDALKSNGAMKNDAGPAAMPSTTAAPAEPKTTAPETTAAMPPSASGGVNFTSSASADQMAASKLMGVAVRNTTDEKLGDINDVIVAENGNPAIAVIGVGGFLGIGEKNVGVPFDALQFTTNDNNKRVARLDVSKKALESAPAFVYSDAKNTAESRPVKTK
jgi:sporulation protein YlmC with PRC-barrel domain